MSEKKSIAKDVHAYSAHKIKKAGKGDKDRTTNFASAQESLGNAFGGRSDCCRKSVNVIKTVGGMTGYTCKGCGESCGLL